MSVTSDQLRKQAEYARDLRQRLPYHRGLVAVIGALEAAADLIDTQQATIRDQNTAAARMANNTELLEALIGDAIDADMAARSREEFEALLADLNALPRNKTHDWRNHISDVVAEHWDKLCFESKLVAFAAAARLANAEEWE